MINVKPWPLYPGKEPVPILKEAGWAAEPVRMGAENLDTPEFNRQTLQPVVCHYTD
jgi:hypothetical protein